MAHPVPEEAAGIRLVHAATGACFLVHGGTGEVLALSAERELIFHEGQGYLHKEGVEARWLRQLLSWRLMEATDGRTSHLN